MLPDILGTWYLTTYNTRSQVAYHSRPAHPSPALLLLLPVCLSISSSSSSIPLPRQTQPYDYSSTNGVYSAWYRFQITRVRASSVCTLCSTVVLTLTHRHNHAVRGHRTGSITLEWKFTPGGKIILVLV